MLVYLAVTALLVSAADHWTTYICLRGPTPGWDAWEANPIVAWLFDQVGLVPGLWLDGVITIAAVTFAVKTHRLPYPVKVGFLGVMIAVTAIAVANNLDAIYVMGLPLF